jgi:hypothetical protein
MLNAYLKEVDKHVIAESTNLSGTKYASHIFNVKASEDIDNGKLVNLDDMKYEKNEYYTMVKPTATSRVGLILSVAVGPDEKPAAATSEYNFYNGKDEIMRVYELARGDRFTLSANGFTGEPQVGKLVEADNHDIKIVDGATSTNAFYGEIIEKITRTNGVFYKVLVRKNG